MIRMSWNKSGPYVVFDGDSLLLDVGDRVGLSVKNRRIKFIPNAPDGALVRSTGNGAMKIQWPKYPAQSYGLDLFGIVDLIETDEPRVFQLPTELPPAVTRRRTHGEAQPAADPAVEDLAPAPMSPFDALAAMVPDQAKASTDIDLTADPYGAVAAMLETVNLDDPAHVGALATVIAGCVDALKNHLGDAVRIVLTDDNRVTMQRTVVETIVLPRH